MCGQASGQRMTERNVLLSSEGLCSRTMQQSSCGSLKSKSSFYDDACYQSVSNLWLTSRARLQDQPEPMCRV